MDIIVDKESDERDQIGESKENELEYNESEIDERYQMKIQNHLKVLISNKNEGIMILLILILS